jgi:hypothetical protein
MTKDYEAGIFKRFWKHNSPSELNNMTDEQVMQLIDEYLERYITGWEKRNKGKELPTIPTATLNDVRNKRTNTSKVPTITGRRSYK